MLVVPVFGWAAYRDIRTRRVPNWTWPPLVLLGVVALAWETSLLADAEAFRVRLFAISVAVSLLLVAPLGYVFWRVGGFGGADAKAIMTLAVVFPDYPVYFLPMETLPLYPAPLRVLSLTILSNTVVLGLAYPLLLSVRNLARGRVALPMAVARPVPVPEVAETYGRVLETRSGYTRSGLDIDALRMYLRWRGATLTALRENPDRYRDGDAVPAPGERNDPGDGSLAGAPVTDGGPIPAVRRVDPWGGAAFLDDVEHAYGTDAETLREGLETLVAKEEVWVTPGIPFVVPMFVGLVAALTFGDVLVYLLGLA